MSKLNRFSHRVINSILLLVVLPIISLRLLGFWQWIEWYSYDLLFYFSSTEPLEERIVLVVWDELDLQNSQEATMNDQTLAMVLSKIKQQQPRLIGLDIYRDIPVGSRFSSDQEDKFAYDQLQKIFLTTPNLVGISKVRKPIINPNPILLQQERTFSSDIITDSDNVIRRSFINANADFTYLGTALGYLYLAHEGWDNQMVGKSSLAISKDQQQIVLEDLKTIDGAYINNKVGLDFLVNWRKGTPIFLSYSVRDLLNSDLPSDALKDKIVVIGNVSSSSPDIHHLPLDKWDQQQPWTEGVKVVAMVASSIISAALDNRPLIRVAPYCMGYLLMILAISLVGFVIYSLNNVNVKKLYLISSLFSFLMTILLLVVSWIAFQTLGWWLPIIPALSGIWLTFLVINYEIQIEREKKTLNNLNLLVRHLSHEIGNSNYAIQMSTEEIETKAEDGIILLDSIFRRQTQDSSTRKQTQQHLEELGKNLREIQQETPKILKKVEQITRHSERNKYYIKRSTLFQKRKKTLTRINDFVRKLVAECFEQYQAQIEIEQIYDSKLQDVKLDTLSLEIILKNLLENALNTILAKTQTANHYTPTVIVKTQKKRWTFEIIVEDNGEGISKGMEEEIFQPGVSGKAAAGGQGIGLFLVKEFLLLEQGSINLETEIGKGSKFTVSFPQK